MQAVQTDFMGLITRVGQLQNRCRHAQHELHDNERALILYCQQFAFAPEMVQPCFGLLNNVTT